MTDRRRGNSLDGRTWTRYSISVWDDIRKSKEELRLKHPALFPAELPRRLIECLLPPEGRVVLDPFCGLGSTILAAQQLGRQGIGLDINPEYVEIARARLREQEGMTESSGRSPVLRSPCPAKPLSCEALVLRSLGGAGSAEQDRRSKIGEAGQVLRSLGEAGSLILHADAAALLDHVAPGTVDMAITSPPYWDVLTRRRTADGKETRHYGDEQGDLGRISDYGEFLTALGARFSLVQQALRPGAYCVAVVMDLRKRNVFYPFHADLASELQRRGFLLDDLIIWDRRQEYNHFRPLGYPSVFRVNKAHEFIMIFQKPRG